MSLIGRVGPTLIGAALLSAACAASRELPLQPDVTDSPPVFEAPPDGGDAEVSPAETLMCPVTTCSPPRATCPSSKFPCDVDLLSDDENCGGCGIRCPGRIGLASWTCVAGRCAFSCPVGGWSDCDGDPSNGCEVYVGGGDNNNCGACGVKCPEGLSCNLEGECTGGCPASAPDKCNENCTNLTFDDQNCGTCGRTCDPTGPDLEPLPADMYYGCENSNCGRKKCSVPDTADCNVDPSDGCEVTLHTNEHCNGCNDACPTGKQCGQVTFGVYACLCEDDAETFCGGFFPPFCKRLDDDPQNCGGCDHICPGLYLPNFSATCTHGVCGGKCADDFADCDGLTDNGCETNTRIDNRHCGACGNACLPDQVCSGGKCLVAPCDAGAPGDPTK